MSPISAKTYLLAVGAWCAGAPLAPAVDLAPRYVDTFIDGVTIHQLFFADGDQKIGVSVDRETAVAAGSGGVVFRFPKFDDIFFLLKHSPMAADQPFEGVNLERYREAAHRMFPPGVEEVKVLNEEADPITINRWHSYRLHYGFLSAGVARHLAVTFLNISAEEQLVMVVSAKEQNFAEAAARSWQVIRSWQPLLPSDLKRAKGT